MSEIIDRPGIRPRWESLKNLWRDKMFILRGQVVVVNIETSLLDRPEVVSGFSGEIETNALAEYALQVYLEDNNESPTTPIEQ